MLNLCGIRLVEDKCTLPQWLRAINFKGERQLEQYRKAEPARPLLLLLLLLLLTLASASTSTSINRVLTRKHHQKYTEFDYKRHARFFNFPLLSCRQDRPDTVCHFAKIGGNSRIPGQAFSPNLYYMVGCYVWKQFKIQLQIVCNL